MLLDLPVVINGDGEQRRDFVYVSDVARANVLALECGNNAVYNLGTGVGIAVNEIFRRLREITGYALPPRHGGPKLGEVQESCLDARKAQRELGWRPEIPLDVGLRQTTDFIRVQCRAQLTTL